ncbi:MAG: sigma-54 dependent transcriptional regulator [Spirochaetota bacterium]
MKVIVVDDEEVICKSIKRYLELSDIEAVCAENGLSAQRMIEQEAFTAAVVDLKMPGMNGLQLLEWIREEEPRLPVIMISAHGEIKDAVEAMKFGAQDYIVKPFEPEELILRLKKVIDEQKLRNQLELGKMIHREGTDLIGSTPALVKIKKIIEKIASTPSTVLITGESGVGKEVVARNIHALSSVSDGPFIGINIGGVPENLIESELFGYERGAFTGASARKLGMFELANGGTLFLDEIGDMPFHLQVKLLRVLQDKRIQRLGGNQFIPIDARLISATNKDLESMVRMGKFREDLFYRLNVLKIEVPPLRERSEDIPQLVGYIVEKLNAKMGKTIKKVSPQAVKKLASYAFPGNIRELENILERAFIFADSDEIEERDIEVRLDKPLAPGPKPLALKEMEKRRIIEALHRWEGNRTKAAEELGITRRTLLNKINEYGLAL